MNKIILAGKIVRANMASNVGQKPRAYFVIQSKDRVYNPLKGKPVTKTRYVFVVCFNKLAELLIKTINENKDQIYYAVVSGKIDSYKAQSGEYRLNVVAEEIAVSSNILDIFDSEITGDAKMEDYNEKEELEGGDDIPF